MAEKVNLEVASAESVAFTMAKDISRLKYDDPDYREKFLDLYAECLEATTGRRSRKATAAPPMG